MVLLQNENIAPQLIKKWKEYLDLNEITVESARSPMNVEPLNSPDESPNHEPTTGDDSEMTPTPKEHKVKPTRRAFDEDNLLTMERVGTGNMAAGDELRYVLGDTPPINLTPYPLAAHPHHNNPTYDYLVRHINSCGSSYWIQTVELFKRAFTFVYTDYSYLIMMLISHLFFAVIVGVIFNNLTDDFTGLQDRIGLLFLCATSNCFTHSNFALNRFRSEKLLYIREQQVGSYSPFLYFWANFLADIPVIVVVIMLQCIVVYFATGLVSSAGAFFYFFAVLTASSLAAFGMGALVGAVFDNALIAAYVVPMLQIPMQMCGGLLANNDQIRPYFIWLEKISIHRYGTILLFHNEFKNLGEITCDPALQGVVGCGLVPKSGPEVMAYLGFDGEQDSEWAMWLSVAMFVVLARGGQLAALYVISRSKS
eukprot:GILI01005263.1.p1 GENE.GILI01005263.1~~GILI01005263.1.p1  ORF type:complete len:437 (+),score=85.79 GILI01005263.1:42-1313(+)